MIERRVLKEKEKRRVKKGGGCRAKGGRIGGPDPAFTFKKSHFLQSQIIVFIKVEKKEVSLEQACPAAGIILIVANGY